MRNKSITVVTLNQGSIRNELTSIFLELPEQRKYNLQFWFPAEKPITNNRNQIVKHFIEDTTDDYLLMIDGDNVPPINILNLADFQKDVMGALCFGWKKGSIVPFILRKNQPGETVNIGEEIREKNPEAYSTMEIMEGQGLVECDAIGTGCIMISRQVLTDPEMKFPFKNEYDENGIKEKGLDIYFCERAKEAGYKVWCHTDYRCSHWATLDIKAVYGGYQNLKRSMDNQNQNTQYASD